MTKPKITNVERAENRSGPKNKPENDKIPKKVEKGLSQILDIDGPK